MSKKYNFPYLKTPKFKGVGGDWRNGILGQFGFFNYFKVIFDRSKYLLRLEKK